LKFELLLLSNLMFMSVLIVCCQPHEQFFSYLAAVTIAGDRAAYLDLCLALLAVRVL
jgi:hypothetical protein